MSLNENSSLNSLQAGHLLEECLQIGTELFVGALSKMLDDIDKSLARQIDQASGDSQRFFQELRGWLRFNSNPILAGFKRQIVEFCSKQANEANPQIISSMPAKPNLTLMEETELEGYLRFKNMVLHMKLHCEYELYSFTKRLQTLFECSERGKRDNPFTCETICKALQITLEAIKVEWTLKRALLKMFDEELFMHMLPVYHQLNNYLIENGILPIIPDEIIKSPITGIGQYGNLDRTLAAQQYEALQQLMLARSTLAASNDSLSLQASSESVSVTQPPPPHSQTVSSLNKGFLPSQTYQFNQPPSKAQFIALMPALTQLQQDFMTGQNQSAMIHSTTGVATQNVLKGIKTSDIGRNMGQIDTMMLELVTMLFDYIFNDKTIPAQMKALIGRLQIPVLKAAILDNTFFSNSTHVVRKLLDAFATASLWVNEELGEGDKIYKKAKELIDKIIVDFGEDIKIFQDSINEFDSFLLEQGKSIEKITTPKVQDVMQHERLEIGKIKAQDIIQALTLNKEIPPEIQEFLNQHWEKVLTLAYLSGGDRGQEWKSAIMTVQDLLWSITVSPNKEEAEKLRKMLPDLLARLRKGLTLICMSWSELDSFFQKLMVHHTAALKRPLRSSAVPSKPLSDSQKIILPLEKDRAIEKILEIRSLDSLSNQPTIKIKVGEWIALANPGEESKRLKLIWISPLKVAYLFIDRRGPNTVLFSSKELIEKFNSGIAQRIDDGPLVDRAVDSIIDALKVPAPG